MARAGPAPTFCEAPDEVARLYRAWKAAPEGERFGAMWDLAQSLYSHRNKWMIIDDVVLYMTGTGRVVVRRSV